MDMVLSRVPEKGWANFISPIIIHFLLLTSARAALYTADNPTATGCGGVFAGCKLTASFNAQSQLRVTLSGRGPAVHFKVGAGPHSTVPRLRRFSLDFRRDPAASVTIRVGHLSATALSTLAAFGITGPGGAPLSSSPALDLFTLSAAPVAGGGRDAAAAAAAGDPGAKAARADCDDEEEEGGGVDDAGGAPQQLAGVWRGGGAFTARAPAAAPPPARAAAAAPAPQPFLLGGGGGGDTAAVGKEEEEEATPDAAVNPTQRAQIVSGDEEDDGWGATQQPRRTDGRPTAGRHRGSGP